MIRFIFLNVVSYKNPLTIGMIKYGEQKEKIINYVMKVAKIIENLNPMLFYVEQDNLELSFRKALKERTPEWSTGFVDYYTEPRLWERT